MINKMTRRAMLAASPALGIATMATPSLASDAPDLPALLEEAMQTVSPAGRGEHVTMRADRVAALCEAAGVPFAHHASDRGTDRACPKQEPDPHRAWLEEWRHVCAKWSETEEDSPEDHYWWSERDRLDDLISGTTARTVDGVAAQAEWLIKDAEDYWACDLHKDAARNILATFRAMM